MSKEKNELMDEKNKQEKEIVQGFLDELGLDDINDEVVYEDPDSSDEFRTLNVDTPLMRAVEIYNEKNKELNALLNEKEIDEFNQKIQIVKKAKIEQYKNIIISLLNNGANISMKRVTRFLKHQRAGFKPGYHKGGKTEITALTMFFENIFNENYLWSKKNLNDYEIFIKFLKNRAYVEYRHLSDKFKLNLLQFIEHDLLSSRKGRQDIKEIKMLQKLIESIIDSVSFENERYNVKIIKVIINGQVSYRSEKDKDREDKFLEKLKQLKALSEKIQPDDTELMLAVRAKNPNNFLALLQNDDVDISSKNAKNQDIFAVIKQEYPKLYARFSHGAIRMLEGTPEKLKKELGDEDYEMYCALMSAKNSDLKKYNDYMVQLSADKSYQRSLSQYKNFMINDNVNQQSTGLMMRVTLAQTLPEMSKGVQELEGLVEGIKASKNREINLEKQKLQHKDNLEPQQNVAADFGRGNRNVNADKQKKVDSDQKPAILHAAVKKPQSPVNVSVADRRKMFENLSKADASASKPLKKQPPRTNG